MADFANTGPRESALHDIRCERMRLTAQELEDFLDGLKDVPSVYTPEELREARRGLVREAALYVAALEFLDAQDG